jgi:hypothetical protein
MTPATRPSRRRLPILIVGLALAAPLASAQGQDVPGTSIDLVFLVDVSGSMFRYPSGAQGNDPQRIRWDAVLLSLDLLTSEDQVLIVPFNDEVPAIVEGNPNVLVPGALPRKLFNPRAAAGTQDAIRSFARHEGIEDCGGTAILYALEQARELMGRFVPGRRRFVVLLTDGEEASKNKPAKLSHLKALEDRFNPLQQPDEYRRALLSDRGLLNWIKHYGDPEIRGQARSGVTVYTIGLGKLDGRKLDETLLELIAHDTGGHHVHLETNGELIDYFRTLIWQLKGCWTKTKQLMPATPAGGEEDRMWGIRDFGAVYYRVFVQPGDPRNYFALGPDETLRFDWSDKDGRPLINVMPSPHATEISYTYDYYDRRGFDRGDRLVSSWAPSNSDRWLRFSKRTDRPLFSISEPSKGTFQRYELLPVKVRMDMGLEFRPEQFDLWVELRKTGEDKKRPPLKERMLLRPDPKSRGEFQLDVELFDLPSEGGETDGYTLAVTAGGRRLDGSGPLDRRDSLSGYTLELPPIDIRVENRLTLKEVPLVTLSNEVGLVPEPIRIQPLTPIRASRNMRPIPLQLEQTWLIQGKETPYPFVTITDPVDLHFVKDTDPASIHSDEAGELWGEIKTRLPEKIGNDRLAKGTYKGGVLRLSGPGIVPLSIPIQVVITSVKLGFDRSPIAIKSVPEGRASSEPIQVRKKANGETLDDSQAVTVSISPQIFDVEELWLETVENPGPKTRSLRLPRAVDKFKVVFEPRKNLINNPTGYYTLELGLDVRPLDYEYDPQDGKVELIYNAPDLVLDKLGPVRIQPGAEGYAELKVGLTGGGGKRRVGLQFLDGRAKPDRPKFRFRNGHTSRIDLEPEGMVELTPSQKPEPGSLGIRLKVPPNLSCGEYTLDNGKLTADLTKPVDVRLTVLVNDLAIEDSQGRPLGSQDRLSFYQVKGVPEGEELVKTIRVFAKEGDLHEPEVDVDVSEERPFQNLDKHQRSDVRLNKPLPKRAFKSEDGKKTGVEIDLSFAGDQPSFQKHSGDLVIRCRERELKKAVPCIVEWVDVLRPAKPAVPKPAVPKPAEGQPGRPRGG